jgi:hypothetical protein
MKISSSSSGCSSKKILSRSTRGVDNTFEVWSHLHIQLRQLLLQALLLMLRYKGGCWDTAVVLSSFLIKVL